MFGVIFFGVMEFWVPLSHCRSGIVLVGVTGINSDSVTQNLRLRHLLMDLFHQRYRVRVRFAIGFLVMAV